MLEMNKNQFNENYLTLHEETKRALKELEDLTGKEVIFRLIETKDTNLHFKLKVKLAREIMDNHIIIINQDNISDKNALNYYIVHEIVHGLRLFKGDKSCRQVVKSKDIEVDKIIQTQVSEVLPIFRERRLDERFVSEYCSFLVRNTFSLFANTCVDARIELYIAENYPGLVKMQKQAQKEYCKEILQSFEKKNSDLIPKWVHLRVNAMNYAYLTKITPIIGKSWTSKANNNMSDALKSLIEEMLPYLETEDKGQVTDLETLNAWADIMGLKEYVYLDDFENINISYLLSN